MTLQGLCKVRNDFPFPAELIPGKLVLETSSMLRAVSVGQPSNILHCTHDPLSMRHPWILLKWEVNASFRSFSHSLERVNVFREGHSWQFSRVTPGSSFRNRSGASETLWDDDDGAQPEPWASALPATHCSGP